MGIFTPAWEGKNQEKALKAVEKSNSQAKLAEIAKNARFIDVRELAANKLTDPLYLKTVAIYMSNYYDVLFEKRFNFNYKARLKLLKIGAAAINKVDDLGMLKDIYDNAKEFNTSSYKDMVNIRNTAKIRAGHLVREKMKTLDQNVLFNILMGNEKSYNGWWFTENQYVSECKDTAFALISDDKLLLEFAQTSNDYPRCIEAYKKLLVLPKEYSIAEVIKKLHGENKLGILDYITARRIAKDEIDTLLSNNEIEVVKKIAAHGDSYACEKTGGHVWDVHCVCTVCKTQEHDWVDGSCRRCGGKIIEESYSYYDGVPGYGTTVSGTSRSVVYPDGTKGKL